MFAVCVCVRVCECVYVYMYTHTISMYCLWRIDGDTEPLYLELEQMLLTPENSLQSVIRIFDFRKLDYLLGFSVHLSIL